MIRTHGLTRTFRRKKQIVRAVTEVDIDVGEGELVAFLGPNGAGKSTTLKMLTSLLRPTSGSAVVAGHDVTTNPAGVRSQIGFIGQGNGGGYSYRAIDELHNQGRFYGLPARDYTARAAQLMEALGLATLGNRTIESLSGGQRRRLDIALGLVNHPPLLFLDEPSTGLDPQARNNLWDHIMAMRERYGMTLALTTHYLEEADIMAERVIIIDQGRVIADATPSRLKRDHADDVITLVVTNPTDTAPEARADIESRVRATLSTPPAEMMFGAAAEPDAVTVTIHTSNGSTRLPEAIEALRLADLTVVSADSQRASLDDVFLNLTGRSLREDAA